MPIITLTTDWKNSDFYVAAVKGRIMGICPEAQIVDVSHSISSFNSAQAAFVLKKSYEYFPAGTIHIIGINSVPEKNQPFLAIEAFDQYFIGTDNGIFALIFGEQVDKIIRIIYDEDPDENKNSLSREISSGGNLFPELNIFAVTAAFLAGGGNIEELGETQDSFFRQIPIRAAFENSRINGSIIYIDSYQNAISNISRDLFSRVGKNRRFEIFIQSNYHKITKINNTYNETTVGELLAVFNSLNLLEIAINKGNAAELLALDLNSVIRVKFYDQEEN